MADSRLLRFFPVLERRRGLVTGILIAVLALSGLSLFNLQFDNTLDLMLPSKSPTHRMITFLRTANFSNKVIISLENRDPAASKDKLFEAADRIASSLKPPMITRVTKGMSAPDLMSDAGFFLRYACQILRSNDLAAIDSVITSEGVGNILKQRYSQLLKPEGMFLGQAIQTDPLDINRVILERLQELSTSLGYAVKVENGHFISQDGRHVMLIAEASASMTDVSEARELLAYLEDQTRNLPAGVQVSLVSGYAHTVSNESTITRDLGVIFTIASVGFILIFVFFFRDIRGLMIFLVPVLSVIIAMALTSLVFHRISYFVLAFGPVIAGIADDYGIATFVAVLYGRRRSEAVAGVAKPVTVGAIATMGIFFAFFFSHIPGYHQLGFFCVTSILLSLFLALFVLPLWLKEHDKAEKPGAAPGEPPRKSLMLVWSFIIFLVVAGLFASRIRFESDVTKLDGTSRTILDTEKKFQQVWGKGERSEAILAVAGTNYEQVMAVNDSLYVKAWEITAAGGFASFASVWPSSQVRTENARRWVDFWKSGRETRLKALLSEHGAPLGFTENAFDPFFARLYENSAVVDEPVSNRVFASLKERFAQNTAEGFQTLSFFPDKPEIVKAIESVIGDRHDAFIVSRTALSSILSKAFSQEIVRTSCFGIFFIVLTAFLFLRTIKSTLVALVPAVAGVTGLLGLMAVMGQPLNVSNLISGIVVFGLCIDFGIHVLHACQHHADRATRTAITLAATTTVMGAGVLLFAQHPALYSVGLTLVAGVGFGYVAAMWVVPAFYALLWKNDPKEHS